MLERHSPPVLYYENNSQLLVHKRALILNLKKYRCEFVNFDKKKSLSGPAKIRRLRFSYNHKQTNYFSNILPTELRKNY